MKRWRITFDGLARIGHRVEGAYEPITEENGIRVRLALVYKLAHWVLRCCVAALLRCCVGELLRCRGYRLLGCLHWLEGGEKSHPPAS
jgi:hypothetical protein